MFKQVEQYRRPRSATVAVAVEQGPDLVGYPADPNRSGPGREDMLVDKRFATPGWGVDLGGRATTDEPDSVAGGNAGRQNVGALKDSPQLGRVRIKFLGLGTGPQVTRVLRE